MDPFSMLELLLSENQFELILPETGTSAPDTIRLVYLMNDAVESFLLFHNARLTGTYDPAYEGELDALLTQDENERYALIVHQGDSVVTLFFEDLTLENHYYDYSQLGHFWMKGYEYLRQLEYRIAILRDKLDYLGENSCNANERELASLAEFPPLNVCCYPSVPEKYRVIRENPWHLSEDASRVFQSIAIEAGDPKLLHRLKDYEQHPHQAPRPSDCPPPAPERPCQDSRSPDPEASKSLFRLPVPHLRKSPADPSPSARTSCPKKTGRA